MTRKIFVFIAFCLGSLTAQTFNHRITASPFNSGKKITSQGTVRILAVMVDFPPDKDGATDGDGTFGSIYSQNYGNNIIDPLPHDKAYFEDHLLFVKNYFAKVSSGKLDIEYTVLPNKITVNKMMRNYSPPNNSSDYSALGNFSNEVWTKADTANPSFDFKDYDLFVIFHAGVGRDVSLPGSINDSKDLPSIYLGLNSLQKIFGSSFNGFPVSNNSYSIPNSLIMPETESREESGFSGTVLYKLTINGLLAASVGSYLGLPDLFNTSNGLSAIGRFGLMDGQAIFAYNGAFPPEPSAWEKIYMGWVNPIALAPGNYSISVAAKMASSVSDTVILKLPISSSEYFLIENRQRDVNNNGATVSYIVGGNSFTKNFSKDQTGFNSTDIDSLNGVVTGVDEYDWALPGQIDDTSKYKGGILIWHIDQNIIDSTIAADRINANKNLRGVNLMEASGVPEIGEIFYDVLGDQVIGEGSYLDYWYSSNPAVLYKNIFSKDTRPSSNTSTGASSLITISNFSASGNKMSFKIIYGDSIIKPIFAKQISFTPGTNKLNVSSLNQNNFYNVISNSNLYVFDKDGNLIKQQDRFSNFKTASINFNYSSYTIGAADSSLNIFINDGNSTNVVSVNTGDIISAPPVVFTKLNQSPVILIGTQNGNVKGYSLSNQPSLSFVYNQTNLNAPVIKISSINDYYSFVAFDLTLGRSDQYTVYDNSQNYYNGRGTVIDFASTVDNSGGKINIALTAGNHFDIISGGKLLRELTISSPDSIKSFALADLKNDGNNYILFSNGKRLDAVNLQGAEADNFPFIDPQSVGFSSTPVAADINGDKKSDIVAATSDGRIFAVDGSSGKSIDEFPISSGAQLSSVPVLTTDNSKISLACVNSQNNFSAWNISAGSGQMFWSEENGNSFNQSAAGSAASLNVTNQFFPASRAYNYPNPVYGGVTYIHYFVSQDSKINIKIFDLAGDFVAELNDNVQGGMEKETAWNVSGIQSGVYLARIQAQSAGGETASNVIKIAVIK